MNRRSLQVLFVACSLACQSKTAPTDGDAADPSAEPSGGEGGKTGAEAHPPAAAAADPGLGPSGPAVLLGAEASGRALAELAKRASWNPLLVAIDTPYQIFEGEGTYVHVAAWTPEGTPVSAASVYANGIEVGRTDETGTLVFIYPPAKGATDPSAADSAIGAAAVTVVADDRCGQVPFNPMVRTASFASDHLYVYSDRGAYRPGETIHTRIIGWHLEQDYGPLAAAHVELSLRSESGETMGATKIDTDEFGIASADLVVPATAAEGLYQLEVAYNQERQSARIQVKDFKPPTIVIEHTLGRFITQAQKTLPFDVTLRPGTGGEFGRGKVTISARAGGRERAKLVADVAGSGPHHFELDEAKLTAVKSALGEGDYATLVVSVRDQKSREDELEREMRFAANPYVAVLELDKDQYATGDPVEVVAKLSDLDGVPQRERKVKLVVGKRELEATTDTSGMARFSLSMGTTTETAQLFIDGVDTAIATATLPWIEPRPMRSHIPEPIVKERATAKVVVHFPTEIEPLEKAVHLDVVDTSGAVVSAVLLPVETEDGKPVARGEFTAPSWGSMLLTFFTLGRPRSAARGSTDAIGLLVEGQNLVVQPDRTLEITLDGLPAQARPGSRVAFTAAVADRQGRPVDAALGAAIVDKRVLALKDPLEITPMDKFYNPELRTMSVTGSKILSWPVVSRNWGGHQHDIALPPFPFKDGGVASTCTFDSGAPGFGGLGLSGTGKGGGGSGEGTIGLGNIGKIGAGAEPPPPPAMAPADAEEGKMGKPSAKPKSLAKDGDEKAAEEQEARPEAPAKPDKIEITVRTQLPDTSLWEPRLRAEGSVRIEATLPQTTGAQELIVVASDKRGGVGVLRREIDQALPVFAEVSFPTRLVAGSSIDVPVTVHNRTTTKDTFEVALSVGSGARERASVEIEPGKQGDVTLRFAPTEPGKTEYVLSARGAGHEDVVSAPVHVVAAGAPERRSEKSTLAKGKPFASTFAVDAKDGGFEAFVRVGFPAVTTAFAGAWEMGRTVSDQPLSLGADVLSTVVVLRYAKANGLTSPQIVELERRALASLGALRFAQAKSGAFSYRRSGRASPYVTGYALEAMLLAREGGIAVEDDVIRRAADFLAGPLARGALAKVDEIAFWEGDTDTVRTGLTAEIYAVLAKVPAELRSGDVDAALVALDARFRSYVGGATLDPLATGRALGALLSRGAIDRDAALKVVKRLLEARDRGHWEPSWFHAYGGTIEATVAVLEALQSIDSSGFVAEKRDALAWILSTRDAWGLWHNERGTAAAIRALVAVGAAPKETEATVKISLDGAVIETVDVDPVDPFLSTAKLAHFDLGTSFAAGEHKLAIDYDGVLEPTVELVTTRFLAASGASATSAGHSLSIASPPKLAVGATGSIALDVALGSDGTATVLVPTSGALEVDHAALELAVGTGGPIADYRITELGTSLLVAPGKPRVRITVPVVAVRSGRSSVMAGLRVVGRKSGDQVTLAVASPLTVSP